MNGAYIALDATTRRLVSSPTGSTFQLHEQQAGTYTFESTDGTYWGGIAKPGKPILSDASSFCPVMTTQQCHLPLTFTLVRQWN